MNKLILSIAAVIWIMPAKGFTQNVFFNVKAKGIQKFITENNVGRNQVSFYSKAPLEDVFGAAADVSGFMSFDPMKLEETMKGEIIVQTKSMTTGFGQRDRDMLGEHWLDVGKYQTIRFKLKKISNTKVIKQNHIDGIATGDFSMHGVTRIISIPISLTYIEESLETQRRAPGDFLVLRSKFSVRFEDYGIKGQNGFLGWRVAKTIDLDVNIFSTNKISMEE